MNPETIKKHFTEHKEVYIGIGIGLTLAGITWVIVRGHKPGLAMQTGPGTSYADPVLSSTGDASPLIFAPGAESVTTNIYTGKKGHPGFITRCIETGDIFSSQQKAADYFQIDTKILSQHLRGLLENAQGYHFEHVGVQ